jgi:tetratricopeptide (TPR) repeat protein
MANRRNFHRGFLAVCLLCGVTLLWGQSQTLESLAQKAGAAREAGRAQEAIRYYTEALRLRPDWDEGLWYLGTIYYDSDRYAEAIPLFRKLTEHQANTGAVWNLLGLSEFEVGDYLHSLTDLQHGLDLGFDDNPAAVKVAKYHIALLLNLNGEFEKATAFLKTEFAGGGPLPDQIKMVLGLAVLRVPLLPDQLDPSKDSLVQSAGEAASFLLQNNFAQASISFQQMLKDYPDTPYLHFAYAAALNPASRPDDALTQLREQIRQTPQWSPAHQLAGQILQTQNKQADAEKEFASAKQFAGKQQEANAKQVSVYARSETKTGPVVQGSVSFDEFARQGAAAQQAGNFDVALNAYRSAVNIRPQWDQGWNMIGTLSYMTGDCLDAIPAFKTAIGINAKLSEAWALLGICEFQTKDYKNSLIHLQQSQRLGFTSGSNGIKAAKYHIAYLLNRNGQFEQAMDLLVPETGPSPVADQIKLAMGVALLRIPRLPDELDTPQKSLVQSAGEAAAALAESKYDKALPIFQQMIQDSPNTPFLHYAYGVALASNSQYGEAQSQLKEETRLNPTSALPYMRLASIALLLHSPNEALNSAQRASELAPETAEGHYLLGRALLELKRAPEAIKPLEMASKLAPSSPQVHFNLAKAYAKAGQNEAAEHERETFTRLNAMAEEEKSKLGSQIYAGSHSQSGLTSAQTGSSPNPE